MSSEALGTYQPRVSTRGNSVCRALGAALFGGTLLALPGCGVQTAPVTGKPLIAAAAPHDTHAHPPPGMVWIPGGTFRMGEPTSSGPQICQPSMAGMTTMNNFADARPVHPVKVDGFFMDRTLVTNAQFAKFVEATGYVTVAEKKPDPALFPGVPPDKLVAGAVVFSPPAHPVPLTDVGQWWRYVPGASWRHPEGPESSVASRQNYPVVEVCWEDAAAYAHWAVKRLPTEAEWERAARGGLDQMPFVWGKTFAPNGKQMANTFQGHFPDRNARTDGYVGTSPVGAFPANKYGLYDMAGNVWEWCADWYRPDYYAISPRENPAGPTAGFDPEEPGVPKRVQRGGSYLCTDEYCSRYRPGGRGKGDPLTGASNAGFRCAESAP